MLKQSKKLRASQGKRKQEAMRLRIRTWRKGNAIARLERPTSPSRARSLGYKAKQGVVVARARIRRGGRRKKRPKAMIVIVKEKKGIERGTGNLTGIDVVTVDQLNTEMLAPGGEPGRLAIFSEGAFKALGELAR